jgi:hypothetical protein
MRGTDFLTLLSTTVIVLGGVIYFFFAIYLQIPQHAFGSLGLSTSPPFRALAVSPALFAMPGAPKLVREKGKKVIYSAMSA